MTGRHDYQVTVNDCAGQLIDQRFQVFEEALGQAQHFQARYPKKAIRICNIDRCDCDSDGLTEDERERLDEVL